MLCEAIRVALLDSLTLGQIDELQDLLNEHHERKKDCYGRYALSVSKCVERARGVVGELLQRRWMNTANL